MNHPTCLLCPSCHCHHCVMQEREVKRQAIESLVAERDEAWHTARQIVSAYRKSEDPEDFERWLEEEAYPLWPQLKEEPAG